MPVAEDKQAHPVYSDKTKVSKSSVGGCCAASIVYDAPCSVAEVIAPGLWARGGSIWAGQASKEDEGVARVVVHHCSSKAFGSRVGYQPPCKGTGERQGKERK